MEWFSRRTAKTEKTCLKLRKYVGFAIEPFKKTFAKTLRQPCYNLELLQNIPKSLNIRTTFLGGNSHLRRVLRTQSKIREMRCISPYFRRWFRISRGGLLQNARYFADIIPSRTFPFAIIRNSCFRKSRRCTPWCAASTMGWRWSFGRSASAAPREMTWRQNWMSQHGLLRFFSQNSSGNPHARIYTP